MPLLKFLLDGLRKLFRRSTPPDPHPPYTGVREPVRKWPPVRSGAVALAEPDED